MNEPTSSRFGREKRQNFSQCTYDSNCAHRQKFSNINDTFKRVIGIIVNGHISTRILSRIRAILVKITVEMCQFTRIPMTRFNVSYTYCRIFLIASWVTEDIGAICPYLGLFDVASISNMPPEL